MVHSMTAFARSHKELDGAYLSWEIRSINHRYLDVTFHLPESFRYLEASLRQVLRDQFNRGKIECQLKYQESVSNACLQLNASMVNALVDLSEALSSSHHLANDLAVSQVLAWPGVLQKDLTNMKRLSLDAMSLFNEGIAQLIEARALEGMALKTKIESRLNHLGKEVRHLKSLGATLAHQVKDKLHGRLHALKLEVSEDRLAQEIAILLTRQDVSEELDRLSIHIAEVARILNSDQIMGRRLDFLMQELNREANTLSSKSDAIALSHSAVEMKVLIEQMREQIQNIE